MLYTVAAVLALASHVGSPAPHRDSVRPDHDVRIVALRHSPEIRSCYESQGLKVNPALRGMIEVEVTVLPTGLVQNANVTTSELQGVGRTAVEACITTAMKNWRYEKGPFVVETIVYPFNLSRESG